MNPNIRVGTFTGNGAAQNIQLGFVPDYVRIINITDGTTAFEWFKGMTAGHAFQNTNHDTAQNSVISSNGITAYNGTAGGNAAGFTVGTAISVDTKVYRYVAMRAGAGAA
jgi:hypothetical protein